MVPFLRLCMYVLHLFWLSQHTEKYSKLQSSKVVFLSRHAKSPFHGILQNYNVLFHLLYVCVFVCVSLCSIQIKAKEVKSYSGDYSNYGFRFLHISPRLDHWITWEFWRRKRELGKRNTKVTIEVHGEKRLDWWTRKKPWKPAENGLKSEGEQKREKQKEGNKRRKTAMEKDMKKRS